MSATSSVLHYLISRFHRGPSREEAAQEVDDQRRCIEERRQKRSQLSPTGAKVWGGEREEGEDEH